MIEIEVLAGNGMFAGRTQFYTSREELVEMASVLMGFPKSADDKVTFGEGEIDESSAMNLSLYCVSGAGVNGQQF